MTLLAQLADLQTATVAELAGRYTDLFGTTPRSRNAQWLRKRIAFRLQETAFGGLSRVANAEIQRLASDIALPAARPSPTPPNGKRAGTRLTPGAVLERQWRGQVIRVEVTADGFVHAGVSYGSLSAVARAVTGSKWNGRLFFGLTDRS